LLAALHSRTREGRLNWQEIDRTDWFMAESGNFLLEIGAIEDRDYPDMPDYTLRDNQYGQS